MNKGKSKPVIASDIDDVKFPFVARFCDFHNRVYRTRLSPENFHTYQINYILGTNADESVRRIDEYHDSDEFLTALPILGAQDAIEHLSSDFRVIDVTARRDNYRKSTHGWLAHFFPQVEEVHFSHNHYAHAGDRKTKAQICLENNAKFLIEDSGDYALQVSDEGILVYLFDQPWNQGIKHRNIIRILSNGKTHWHNLLDAVYRDVE